MARSEQLTDLLNTHGASFIDWRGTQVVESFGAPRDEYKAIRSGFAVADRSERETVVGSGAEVVPLLQGLVLGDVFQLAEEGSGQLNAAVNLKGRYVSELRLVHVPDLLLIDLEPGMIAEGALSHFKRQIINEDAKFHDRSDRSTKILAAGPDAGEWLDETGTWAGGAPTRLNQYYGTWGELAGVEVIAVRLPTFGSDAWELLADVSQAHTVWAKLTEAGAVPVGQAALEVARIETGVPRWGVELSSSIIPLEAGMSWMVSFDKGCYLGQEIIARIDTLGTPAKELRAIDLGDESLPAAGDGLTVDGKKAGEVITAIESPELGGTLVHAWVKRKFNEPGTEVHIGDAIGSVKMPGFARNAPK
jgi:folate-binding protein YgfZ